MEMLPEIQAEQQLLAIEAAGAPYMTPSDARALKARYTKRLRGETRARSMHEALMEAGIRVKRTKLKKRPSTFTGRDGTRRGGMSG